MPAKSIRFYVNESDIEEGVPRNSEKCPMARAIKRKTGAVVSAGSWVVGVGDCLYSFSKAGTAFIKTFDRDQNVKTGHFTITRYEA